LDTRRVEAQEEVKFERPVFIQQLSSLESLQEGQYAYIEARVEPANDDKLIIEWHKNGQYLVLGSRITTRFDFGAISLEIMDSKAEDSGIYTCRSTIYLNLFILNTVKLTLKRFVSFQTELSTTREKPYRPVLSKFKV
jgi:hypothetical protein